MDEIISQLAKSNALLADSVIIYIAANVVVGVLAGFFGRKLFYIWMGLTAVFFGFVIATSLGASSAVALVFGAVCALLSILFSTIGIFFTGAVIGIGISSLIDDTNILMTVGFAFGSGMLAIILTDLALIIVTSFTGALLITNASFSVISILSSNETGILSADSFIPHIIDVAITFNSNQTTLLVATTYIYEIIALFLVFCVYQLKFGNKSKPKQQVTNNKVQVFVARVASNEVLRKIIYSIFPKLSPSYELERQEAEQARKASREAEMAELKQSYKDAFQKLRGKGKE